MLFKKKDQEEQDEVLGEDKVVDRSDEITEVRRALHIHSPASGLLPPAIRRSPLVGERYTQPQRRTPDQSSEDSV